MGGGGWRVVSRPNSGQLGLLILSPGAIGCHAGPRGISGGRLLMEPGRIDR